MLDAQRLERRHAHVKVAVQQFVLDHALPLLLVRGLQLQHAQRRRELGKLARPVAQHRLGHENEVRARHLARLFEVRQEGDGLERLAQAHLVCKDAADVVVVQVDHPVEALQLRNGGRAGGSMSSAAGGRG